MSRSVIRIESEKVLHENMFEYRVMHLWNTKLWLKPRLPLMARRERHYWNRSFNATTGSFGPLHQGRRKVEEAGKDVGEVLVHHADRGTDVYPLFFPSPRCLTVFSVF